MSMFTSCFARYCSRFRCAKRGTRALNTRGLRRPQGNGYSLRLNKYCKGTDFLLNLRAKCKR